VSFPDTNVDLRRSGIEAQIRAKLELIIPSEVSRVEQFVKNTPGAKRIHIHDRGLSKMLFDYRIDGEA